MTAPDNEKPYREALYQAGQKAAGIVQEILEREEGNYSLAEQTKLNTALALLAIIESSPVPHPQLLTMQY